MGKCILIYDDDPDMLTVCKIILTKQNYRVEIRNHCADIIDDVLQTEPDMILMDLWIPDTGGEVAIRQIQAAKGAGSIPIILFSANTEIEQAAERVHASGFLKKPFEIGTLLDTIQEQLGDDSSLSSLRG